MSGVFPAVAHTRTQRFSPLKPTGCHSSIIRPFLIGAERAESEIEAVAEDHLGDQVIGRARHSHA